MNVAVRVVFAVPAGSEKRPSESVRAAPFFSRFHNVRRLPIRVVRFHRVQGRISGRHYLLRCYDKGIIDDFVRKAVVDLLEESDRIGILCRYRDAFLCIYGRIDIKIISSVFCTVSSTSFNVLCCRCTDIFFWA